MSVGVGAGKGGEGRVEREDLRERGWVGGMAMLMATSLAMGYGL